MANDQGPEPSSAKLPVMEVEKEIVFLDPSIRLHFTIMLSSQRDGYLLSSTRSNGQSKIIASLAGIFYEVVLSSNSEMRECNSTSM